MSTPDPLRGSNLPPVPPTAPPPIPVTGSSRHAELVTPDGEPLSSVPTLTEAHHLIQRVGRDVILLVIALVVVLIVALVAGWFALDARNTANDVDARVTASDTERARVDGVHRDSICLLAAGLRGTYSTAGREAFPSGTGAYDALFARFAQASAKLNCDAG